MTPPAIAAADVAEVIDIFTRPERADPRGGELVDRYLASLDQWLTETLPDDGASWDELLERLRE